METGFSTEFVDCEACRILNQLNQYESTMTGTQMLSAEKRAHWSGSFLQFYCRKGVCRVATPGDIRKSTDDNVPIVVVADVDHNC